MPLLPPLRKYALCLAALTIGILPWKVSAVPPSKYDKNAQSLAKQLGPVPPAKKVNPGDLAKTKARMISIIQVIEKSDRSGSTNAESLLSKAMYFREDMGAYEKLITSRAIIDAWETSREYGLFTKAGTFSGTITQGKHQGDSIAFELAIPADRYPEGSNQIANLRIVPTKEKRTGDELSKRDLAFEQQLVRLTKEQKSFREMHQRAAPVPTNSVGMNKEQAHKAWLIALKDSEGALDRRPNIRISSSMSASPANLNQYRWRLSSTIRNSSLHPTEVKVTIYMLGQSAVKNRYYMMAVKDYNLQLRQNEIRDIETFSKSKDSYKSKVAALDGTNARKSKSRGKRKGKAPNPPINYRGNIIIVRHKGKVVAFHGSDARLMRYADENDSNYTIDSIPVF